MEQNKRDVPSSFTGEIKRSVPTIIAYKAAAVWKLILREYVFNYYFLHMTYTLIVIFIASGILCGIQKDIRYIDSLFTCTSAITTTGLIVLDTSLLPKTAQVLIFFLILLGNGILLSLVPLVKRILFSYLPKLATSNKNDNEKIYAKLQIRACIIIIVVVLVYWVCCVLIGISIFLTLGLDPEYNYVIHDKFINLNNGWFSTFNTISVISNAGFSLMPDSSVSLAKLFVPIATSLWLIASGVCFYPIFLRIIFCCLKFFFPHDKAINLIYKFPRLVYTHLFLNSDTIKLLIVLLILNTFQFSLALGLDWDDPILEGLSSWEKVYNEAMQSFSTKHAGINSLNIAAASIAVIVLYIGCMYLSAYPVTISVRGTKIEDPTSSSHYVRDMFFNDLLIVFIGVLIICIIENENLKDFPDDYTALKIVFEVVSAYGTVGLSLGYGSEYTSFSYAFHTGSKVIIIIIMVLGKHRPLPNSDDPALTGRVSLEDFEKQWQELFANTNKKEEEDTKELTKIEN